ncbi:hypothetical protein F5878DRAFT_668087 [Lentinula raphanica]|uniref:Uncharacterized protein n=1 Tax=Lentinula raphanica TaxID=153919 RepID=A0AA38NUU9_9AGAR|nr:hypothetical protein F5878DRAFT_668087 [Lentinula raphanica]
MARRSHRQISTLYVSHQSRSTTLADGSGFLYAFVDRGHNGNGNGIGSVRLLVEDGCRRLGSRGDGERNSGAPIDPALTVLDAARIMSRSSHSPPKGRLCGAISSILCW